MTTSADKHRKNADEFLDHADDMVEKEEHLQASEKIWGAVAQTLNDLPEERSPEDVTVEEEVQLEDELLDMEFANNPEPRCPVLIIADCSGSMSGRPIDAMILNDNIQHVGQVAYFRGVLREQGWF